MTTTEDGGTTATVETLAAEVRAHGAFARGRGHDTGPDRAGAAVMSGWSSLWAYIQVHRKLLAVDRCANQILAILDADCPDEERLTDEERVRLTKRLGRVVARLDDIKAEELS